MITVVFYLDLSAFASGQTPQKENRAIQEVQATIENSGLTGSSVQYQSKACLALVLPNDERILGELVYWCNHGNLPYKTLWLNDVAEWRDGAHQNK